ncbi:hypothetical protein BKA62DRAFT_825595 [Auriculariales sp. MPI-PUGE-AT-0066]|nr:hypothetical protein BKA62DRAFT_825595 [Auriculariales sp. MPI-PUGE-AT-0066]
MDAAAPVDHAVIISDTPAPKISPRSLSQGIEHLATTTRKASDASTACSSSETMSSASSAPFSETSASTAASVPLDYTRRHLSYLNQNRARAQIVELRASLECSNAAQRRRVAEVMQLRQGFKEALSRASPADMTDSSEPLLAKDERDWMADIRRLQEKHRDELTNLRFEHLKGHKELSMQLNSERLRIRNFEHQLRVAKLQVSELQSSIAVLSIAPVQRIHHLEEENSRLIITLGDTSRELFQLRQLLPVAHAARGPVPRLQPPNAGEVLPASKRDHSAIIRQPRAPELNPRPMAMLAQNRTRSISATVPQTTAGTQRVTLQTLVNALPSFQPHAVLPQSVSSPVMPVSPHVGETSSFAATVEFRPRAGTAPSLLPAVELRVRSASTSAAPSTLRSNPAMDAFASAFGITAVTPTTPAASAAKADTSPPALSGGTSLGTNSTSALGVVCHKSTKSTSGGSAYRSSKPARQTVRGSRSVSGPVDVTKNENVAPSSQPQTKRGMGGRAKARHASFSRPRRMMGDVSNITKAAASAAVDVLASKVD